MSEDQRLEIIHLKEQVVNLRFEVDERRAQLLEAQQISKDNHRLAKKYHAAMWGQEAADIAYAEAEAKNPWLKGYVD